MLSLRDIRVPLPPPTNARNSCRTDNALDSCRTAPEASTPELPPVSAYTDPEVCAYCEEPLTEENRGGTVYNHLGDAETWCTTCLLDKYWSDRADDLRETDWPEDYCFHGTTRFGEPEW